MTKSLGTKPTKTREMARKSSASGVSSVGSKKNAQPQRVASPTVQGQPDPEPIDPVDGPGPEPVDEHAALIGQYRFGGTFSASELGAVVRSESAQLLEFSNNYRLLVATALGSAVTLIDLKQMDFAVKRMVDVIRLWQQIASLDAKLEQIVDRPQANQVGHHHH